MRLGKSNAIAVATIFAAVPASIAAQSTGLEDMVGARAGQAEAALQSRGYRFIRGEKGDDRSYAYWWNDVRRQCVTIATMDGRYNSITPTTAPDCRQSVAGRPGGDGSRPDYPPRRDYPDDRGDPPRRDYADNRGYPPPPGYPSGGGGPIVDGRNVELGLVCFGDGSRDGIASGTTWTWNRERDRYEYGRYNETRTEVFDASLMVQTWSGGGRIRLPRSLIPPINSRGNGGWWDLYDVSVGPDLISATYRLNGLNKPRLTIDRRSGRITVQGTASYGFRGRCDQIGNEPRRF